MTAWESDWRPTVARSRAAPSTLIRRAGWTLLIFGVVLAGFVA